MNPEDFGAVTMRRVKDYTSTGEVIKTMDLTEQTIKIIGNTAIVRHKLFAETNNRNVPATVKLGILLVFQKTKKDWKLIARQAVKI